MPRIAIPFIFLFLLSSCFLIAQDSNHDHSDHNGHNKADDHHATHDNGCGHGHGDEFEPGPTAFHHISDQNVYSIGPWQLPLPCIIYVPEGGWHVFSSGKFHADAHGVGEAAYDGFVLYAGIVRRVVDPAFPKGEVALGKHKVFGELKEVDGKQKEVIYVCYKDKKWKCDNKSTADGGLFGGGITSFYDFSITKNVMSMFLVFVFMAWMFFGIARAYRDRDGQSPKGIQSFIEPIIMFIRDEVAIPFIGHKWERFFPFLLSLFFFILGLNLFGQIPFFGGSNPTGNLGVTMVLAIFAFLVVNLNGNKHYWEHILWMPGLPIWVRPVLTFVEFLGVFIKPLTLMLRLFANITAGHMVIVIFVGMIFIFGESGNNPGGAFGTAVGSTLLTMFMMSIELLVAFIQAFVFTILTASYIGAAVEEGHHAEDAAHHH